jgi:hypothetical protein
MFDVMRCCPDYSCRGRRFLHQVLQISGLNMQLMSHGHTRRLIMMHTIMKWPKRLLWNVNPSSSLLRTPDVCSLYRGNETASTKLIMHVLVARYQSRPAQGAHPALKIAWEMYGYLQMVNNKNSDKIRAHKG